MKSLAQRLLIVTPLCLVLLGCSGLRNPEPLGSPPPPETVQSVDSRRSPGSKPPQYLLARIRNLREQIEELESHNAAIRDKLARKQRRVWELEDRVHAMKKRLRTDLSDPVDHESKTPSMRSVLRERNQELLNQLEQVQRLRTREEGRKVVMTVPERILFDVGKARLKPRALPTLNQVSRVIERYPNRRVVVKGHADTQPISTVRYPSNWHLSAARAVSVVRYLVREKGLDPGRFQPIGMGDHHPVAPNDTPANRQLNRRVEIVLYPPSLPEQPVDTPIESGDKEL